MKKEKNKKKEIVPTIPTPETIEDEFSDGLISLEAQIEEQFPEALVKIIKKIAYEISVIGLSEKEACLIANYSPEKFIEMKVKYPMIEQLVEMKDLEYKRGLLKNISSKARTTDDKLAQWLLEARYPNEFNRRKGVGGGGDGGENDDKMIGLALEFVRKTGDRNSLISEESGRAFIIKGRTKDNEILTDVRKVLD